MARRYGDANENGCMDEFHTGRDDECNVRLGSLDDDKRGSIRRLQQQQQQQFQQHKQKQQQLQLQQQQQQQHHAFVFKAFTQESLIEKRKRRLLNASNNNNKKQSVGFVDATNQPARVRLEPDPYLASGQQLPCALIRQMPLELIGKPIEDIDPYYDDQETFVIISSGKELTRFSASEALYLLGPFHPIRRIVLYILVNPIFNLFVILTILTNCILMTLQNNNDGVDSTEVIFTIIYTTEMGLKVLARGFIVDEFTYLRDPWNWLDFAVIIMAYVTLVVDDLGNLSVIRTFRVLRALKTVAIIPGMKTIVGAVIDSVKNLKDVVVLTLFSLSVFSLSGLQIYMGQLTQKCIKNGPNNMNDTEWFNWCNESTHWVPDPDNEIHGAWRLCGNATGAQSCPKEHTCIQGFGANPDYGYTNFDTFGWSLICSFRLMTQDFWEGLYMQVLKTAGSWHILFFIVSIFLGSIYLMNLILAIVAMSYNELQRRAEEEEEAAAEDEAAFLESCRQMELQEALSEYSNNSGLSSNYGGYAGSHRSSYRPSVEIGLVGQSLLASLCRQTQGLLSQQMRDKVDQQMILASPFGGYQLSATAGDPSMSYGAAAGANHASRSHSLSVNYLNNNNTTSSGYVQQHRRGSSIITSNAASIAAKRSSVSSAIYLNHPRLSSSNNRHSQHRHKSMQARPFNEQTCNTPPMIASSMTELRRRSSTKTVASIAGATSPVRGGGRAGGGALASGGDDQALAAPGSTHTNLKQQLKQQMPTTRNRLSPQHHHVSSGCVVSGGLGEYRSRAYQTQQQQQQLMGQESEEQICESFEHQGGTRSARSSIKSDRDLNILRQRAALIRIGDSLTREGRAAIMSSSLDYYDKSASSELFLEKEQDPNKLSVLHLPAASSPNSSTQQQKALHINRNQLPFSANSPVRRRKSDMGSSSGFLARVSRFRKQDSGPIVKQPKSIQQQQLEQQEADHESVMKSTTPPTPTKAPSQLLATSSSVDDNTNVRAPTTINSNNKALLLRSSPFSQQLSGSTRTLHNFSPSPSPPPPPPLATTIAGGGGAPIIRSRLSTSGTAHQLAVVGPSSSSYLSSRSAGATNMHHLSVENFQQFGLLNTRSSGSSNAHHHLPLQHQQQQQQLSHQHHHLQLNQHQNSEDSTTSSMLEQQQQALAERIRLGSRGHIMPLTMVRSSFSRRRQSILGVGDARTLNDDERQNLGLSSMGATGKRMSTAEHFNRRASDWSRLSMSGNVDLRRLLRLWSHTNPYTNSTASQALGRPSVCSFSNYSQANGLHYQNANNSNNNSPNHSIKDFYNYNIPSFNNSPRPSSVGSARQAYELISAISRRRSRFKDLETRYAIPMDDDEDLDQMSVSLHDKCLAYCLSFLDILCIWECCGAWVKIQRIISIIVFDPFTELFIILCILINTLFMALDSDDVDANMKTVFERANYFFTATFAVEASMKIMALSPKFYFREGWNVFDSIIVCFSLLELGLEGVYGLSVLRSFRLLRVFKLAKSWPTLNLLISIMGKAVGDVGNLTFVLAIIVFIFAVMGMQLFGQKYAQGKFPSGEVPRWNFIDFMHSFMIVFRILCAEWIEPMWDCMIVGQWPCIPFFLIAVTVGNLVVLNLFLALLLASFGASNLSSPQADNVDTKKLREAIERFARFGRWTRKKLLNGFQWLTCHLFKKKRTQGNNLMGVAGSSGSRPRGESKVVKSHIVAMSRLERLKNIELKTEELKNKIRRSPEHHYHLRQLAKRQLKHEISTSMDNKLQQSGFNFNYSDRKSTLSSRVSGIGIRLSTEPAPVIPIIVDEATEADDDQVTPTTTNEQNSPLANDSLDNHHQRQLDSHNKNHVHFFSLPTHNQATGVAGSSTNCWPITNTLHDESILEEIGQINETSTPISKLRMLSEKQQQQQNTSDVETTSSKTFPNQKNEYLSNAASTLVVTSEALMCPVQLDQTQRSQSTSVSSSTSSVDELTEPAKNSFSAEQSTNNSNLATSTAQRHQAHFFSMQPIREDSRDADSSASLPENDLAYNKSSSVVTDSSLPIQDEARERRRRLSISKSMFKGMHKPADSIDNQDTMKHDEHEPTLEDGDTAAHVDELEVDDDNDDLMNQQRQPLIRCIEPEPANRKPASEKLIREISDNDLEKEAPHKEATFEQELEDQEAKSSSLYLKPPKQREDMDEDNEKALQHIETYIEKCICFGIICLKWFLFRQYIRKIVEHRYFDQCILVLIVISSGTLALEDKHLNERPTLKQTLDVLDTIFTIIFSLEMILKWLAFGIRRYFGNIWSWLDFVIVLVSFINLMAYLFGSGKLQALKTIRTLRAMRGLRPLRALQRFQGMRVVVNALIQAIPSIFNVLLVCLIFWLIFSIMGVQMFGGKFWRCLDPETMKIVHYSKAANRIECLDRNLTWSNPQINFDNVLNAYLALFQVATFKGWIDIMNSATDSRGRDDQPIREANIYMYFYFVFFVIFGSFFTLNLFIGVIIDNFNEQKKKTGGSLEIFMTEDQKKYYHAMKKMKSKRPVKAMTRPKIKLQAILFDITTSKKFDMIIMIIIGLNMFVMALEHYGQSAEFSMILENLNLVFIAIFTLECLCKIFAMRHFYFREPWNVFDFIVVDLSILGVVMKEYVAKYFVSPTLLRVVRVVKVGRVLRLVKGAKGIRTLLFALAMSLPALFNICLLLFLVMFIYAIFGMSFFMNVRPRAGIDETFNFHTFTSSIIVLFQMSTSAAWDVVLDPLMDEEVDCQKPDPSLGIEGTCGNKVIAIIYLVSYVIVTFLIIINMYIAVILENYSQATEDVQEGLTDDDYEMYYEIWQKFDPDGTQYLPYEKLSDFVDALDDPLRIAKPNDLALVVLDINIYEGNQCYCVDILDALTKFFFTRKGLVIQVNEHLQKVQSILHETPFERITTTYLVKRQHYCARLIQNCWRRWKEKSAANKQAKTNTTSESTVEN